LPALYDPSTSTLQINPSTPLYLLAHRAKRLRTAALPSSASKESKIEWRVKRNDLGEVFGTRKAKSQIKAAERNKVDVGAMQGVKGHLMESIGERMEEGEYAFEFSLYIALIWRGAGPVGPSDLIPAPNLTTSEVSEIYSRDTLIPPAEYSSIDVSNILHARDDKGRSASLPWRRSRWIEDKMRMIVQSASSGSTKRVTLLVCLLFASLNIVADRKESRRMCYYLSTILLLHDLAPQLHKIPRTDLPAKFPGVPEQLRNGCISRFTESSGKRYTVTDKTRTKLLAWICALYLSLNDWTIPVGTVAAELKLSIGKYVYH